MWRFASALATGTSHVRTGLPCQDRIICRTPSENAIIIVVSDGAGSAAKGEVGAEIATTVFCESIEAQLVQADTFDAEAAIRQALTDVIAAIQQRAEGDGAPIREYAATLLAFVQVGETAAAIQIGDGVICLSDEADTWAWFEWPQRGEYASSTYFVTDKDAEGQARVDAVSPAPRAVRFGARSTSKRIRTHRKKSAADRRCAPIAPQNPKRLRRTRWSAANRLFLG